MTDKPNTSFKISENDVPDILRVCGEVEDPNLQDVPLRDLPKYLREQYWIKQWDPTSRWNRDYISGGASGQLRLADLNRKLDDPGDAFFELGLCTFRSSVSLRIWVEVTEVFLPGQAKMVNKFIRENNGLRGKGEIDTTEFLNSLKLGLPDACLQREVADKVIEAIEKKAKKGRDEGSYKSLVLDYGRGVLIVGLPIWFATYPSDPTDPSNVLKDFGTRLIMGLDAIKQSILQAGWCPFDSIVILWNPTLEAVEEWDKIANPDFYSDSLFGKDSVFRKVGLLKRGNTIRLYRRWDRYLSLDAMLADQRLPNNPRPLGPKANLKVDSMIMV